MNAPGAKGHCILAFDWLPTESLVYERFFSVVTVPALYVSRENAGLLEASFTSDCDGKVASEAEMALDNGALFVPCTEAKASAGIDVATVSAPTATTALTLKSPAVRRRLGRWDRRRSLPGGLTEAA